MMILGFGRRNYYLTDEQTRKISWCSFPVAVLGPIGTGLARVSIPALLAKFGMSRTWKQFLWTAVIVQMVLALMICVEIISLCACRPLTLIWQIVPAECLPLRVLWWTTYVHTGK
jgi:hypothetical protein